MKSSFTVAKSDLFFFILRLRKKGYCHNQAEAVGEKHGRGMIIYATFF